MRKWSVGLTSVLLAFGTMAQEIQLLNVSYDPTRELYQEYDTAFFSKYWQQQTGDKVKSGCAPFVRWLRQAGNLCY